MRVQHLVGRQAVLVGLVGAQLGRRRAGDDVLRDHRRHDANCGGAPGATPASCDRSLITAKPPAMSPYRVRVADRHLRLVAGGEHDRAELVRQRHQQRAAHPRLQVLLGRGLPAGPRTAARARRERRRMPGRSESCRSARRGGAPSRRHRPGSCARCTATASSTRARARRRSRRTAMASVSAESTPPESPSTAPGKPFLAM